MRLWDGQPRCWKCGWFDAELTAELKKQSEHKKEMERIERMKYCNHPPSHWSQYDDKCMKCGWERRIFGIWKSDDFWDGLVNSFLALMIFLTGLFSL